MSTEQQAGRAGRVAIVSAGVLWGTAGTAQALGHLSGMGLAVGGARTIVAASALAAFAAITRRHWPLTKWSSAMFLAAVGAGAALALYQTMFFVGAAKTGVAIGTLVAVGLAPVIAGGIAVLVRRSPSRSWMLATSLSIVGLCLLLLRTSSPVDAWGIAAAVSAAFAYVGYTAMTRRLFELGGQPLDILIVIFMIGALISAPTIALNWDQTVLAAGETRALVAILVLGLVSTFVPYLLWIRGMRTVPTTMATTLSLSEPLVGTLLGIVILGERLTPVRAAGAALLVAGLAFASLTRPVQRR
ncbi:MAG TPA: EamA family transporter [Candidatus Limnocylindrales bacterium]